MDLEEGIVPILPFDRYMDQENIFRTDGAGGRLSFINLSHIKEY